MCGESATENTIQNIWDMLKKNLPCVRSPWFVMSVVWVGEVLSEVGVPTELDELFFICGRSKMSRTEKLDERGILISSNLKRKLG